MVFVKKKKGESDDKLISRFRKKVVNSGVLEEARLRKHHVPKSQKRKEKKARLKYIDEKKRESAKNN